MRKLSDKGKSDISLSCDVTRVRFAPCRLWLFNIANKSVPYRDELFSKKNQLYAFLTEMVRLLTLLSHF